MNSKVTSIIAIFFVIMVVSVSGCTDTNDTTTTTTTTTTEYQDEEWLIFFNTYTLKIVEAHNYLADTAEYDYVKKIKYSNQLKDISNEARVKNEEYSVSPRLEKAKNEYSLLTENLESKGNYLGIYAEAKLNGENDRAQEALEMAAVADGLAKDNTVIIRNELYGDKVDDSPKNYDVQKDSDGDQYPDVIDAFPKDARYSKDYDRDGIADEIDSDIDGDGYENEVDDLPKDRNYHKDSDGDGFADKIDNFPFDDWRAYDSKAYHPDTDGDGILDRHDDFPNDARYYRDQDGDGIANEMDLDIDGDRYINGVDDFPEDKYYHKDSDGDGIADRRDEFPNDARYSKTRQCGYCSGTGMDITTTTTGGGRVWHSGGSGAVSYNYEYNSYGWWEETPISYTAEYNGPCKYCDGTGEIKE